MKRRCLPLILGLCLPLAQGSAQAENSVSKVQIKVEAGPRDPTGKQEIAVHLRQSGEETL